MKTKNLLVWVCIALCTALFTSRLSAQTPASAAKPDMTMADTSKNIQYSAAVMKRVDELENMIKQLQQTLTDRKDLSEDDAEDIKSKLSSLETELVHLRSSVEKGTVLNDTNHTKRFVIDETGMRYTWKEHKNMKADSTRKEKKRTRNIKTGLIGLDLGFNTYLDKQSFTLQNANKDFSLLNAHSINVNLHVLPTAINIYRHNLYLTTSLDFDWNNYRFAKSITLQPKRDTLAYTGQNFSYHKDKLTTCYLEIPLMLNIETRPHHEGRSIHLAAGGFAGIRIDSYTKQTSDENGLVRIHDKYSLNDFRYGVGAKIGVGQVHLYANYALSSMFEKDKGPEFNTFSFGVQLIGLHW